VLVASTTAASRRRERREQGEGEGRASHRSECTRRGGLRFAGPT
jgi:hypothetical protein